MAHDLLTRESPEIIRFFQDIGHITELLRSEPDRYRPVLNGDRYITEAELSESLKITRRTLVEHRTTGLIPYYRLGGRKLYNVSIYTGMNGIYMKRTSLGKFPKTFSSILSAFKKLPACFHPAVL